MYDQHMLKQRADQALGKYMVELLPAFTACLDDEPKWNAQFQNLTTPAYQTAVITIANCLPQVCRSDIAKHCSN